MIQAYNELEENCKKFHPHWEEVVAGGKKGKGSKDALGRYIRFGRVNVRSNPGVVQYLPIAPRLLPTTFIYVPAYGSRV